MATPPSPLDPLSGDIDAFTTDLGNKFTALSTEIAGLKAGVPVTQAQIDSLRAKVQGLTTTVDSFNP